MKETTATSDFSPPVAPGPAEGRRTLRFRTRQAAVVRAAVDLINQKGVRGMTLVDVAAQLGIVPTGVIYYFKSKEELAAACFLRAIEADEALIGEAMLGRTRRDRIRVFVEGYVSRVRDVALGKRDRVAVFNDVRALNDPVVNSAYADMFRHARSLIAPLPPRGEGRQSLNAVTHMLLSQLFWSVVWLPLYDPDDYDRVARRILHILENGLAADGAEWVDASTAPAENSSVGDDVSRETFLRAATQIINEYGYVGASVDKISARLNVTKGSFYHHNEAKDDLVVACFRRTLEVMRRTQRHAVASADNGWLQLASTATALVYCQASGSIPLLRTSALTSTPEAMQRELVCEFDRVSLNFSSMISDGMMDGSMRPVDAHIGAQMVTAMVNAASELGHWAPGLTPPKATEAYVRALLQGMDCVLAE